VAPPSAETLVQLTGWVRWCSFSCRESIHQLLFSAPPTSAGIDTGTGTGAGTGTGTGTEPETGTAGTAVGAGTGTGTGTGTGADTTTHGQLDDTSKAWQGGDGTNTAPSCWFRMGASRWMPGLQAFLLVAAAAGVAVAIPNVEVVFGFTGALCAVNVMYTFPAMLYVFVCVRCWLLSLSCPLCFPVSFFGVRHVSVTLHWQRSCYRKCHARLTWVHFVFATSQVLACCAR